MLINNNLENPIFLILLVTISLLINTLLSTHFMLITFAGILFNAFYLSLKNRYFYSLIFIVFAYFIVEINFGLKPLILTILSFFIYIFILPNFEKSFSMYFLIKYIRIIIFYIGIILIWELFFSLEFEIISVLFINALIDIFIQRFIIS